MLRQFSLKVIQLFSVKIDKNKEHYAMYLMRYKKYEFKNGQK